MSKSTKAVAEMEHPGSEGTSRKEKGSGASGGAAGQAGRGAPARATGPREGSQFFQIYKPGQGYYTRMGTAIGGGILILGAGHFVFKNLEVFRDASKPWTLWIQVGIPTLLVVGLGFLLYWIVGVNRTACDFFIATEGEMKKVSWSSRNELVGSTKVVIAFTLFLAFALFGVDAVFIKFFQLINVLKGGA